MAIKLAELGVPEVVTLLKADLAGILTAIDTARADGVTLAAPASGDYYDYPRQVIAGEPSQIEVFEGVIEFTNPYSDVAIPRATYPLPLTVRLTYFNRDGDTVPTMMKRHRRYGSGIVQVFLDKPTLGGVDDSIQVAVATVVEPPWITEGEDHDWGKKARVVVGLLLTCEEI